MPIAPGVLFQPQPTSRTFFGEGSISFWLMSKGSRRERVLTADWTSEAGLQSLSVSIDEAGLERRGQRSKVECVKRHGKLFLHFLETHAVEHYRLVAFQRDSWNDRELTLHAIARGDEITTGQKPGDAHITAKVFVLDCHNFQTCLKTPVQSLDLLAQDGSENCARHDRTVKLLRISQRFALQPAHQCFELIRKAAHHADAVFNLRVIAVMLSRGHLAAGSQVNLVTQKRERRAQARA